MIATYSSLAMVTSAVLYLIALGAHAAEWALSAPKAAASERVAVGAGAATGSARSAAPQGDARQADAAATPGGDRAARAGRIGLAFTLVGALCQIAGVVLRGIAAERLPWGNMYEFVTSTLAFAVVAYLILVWRRGWDWLGLPVTLLLALGQGLAVTVFYVAVAPLVPALHSVWFVIHIVAAAIAGAAFNLGGIAAVLYLLRTGRRGERGHLARLPRADALDDFSYRVLRFAFPLWTFTIAAGAIWADYAWGRFWGWDPKETWSLVTWVVYAAYLHARATAGWKGRRAAWLAVIGVASFWFNFVGVNLLFSGLHSYAGI